MLRRLCFVALLATTFIQAAGAAEKPLFTAGTETSVPGEIRPPEELVRFVLGSIDKHEIEELDACLSDEGFNPSDYAALLSAVRIRADGKANLWFVRPSLKPFCFALYGAHLFRYFWIKEEVSSSQHTYRLLFHSGGDLFAVYPQKNHGLNDIEATGCWASGCSSTRMAFNGREYRPTLCSGIEWDEQHRKITHSRRCDSKG